ncbi:MAG TPA: hypothetical protein VHG70_12145 [Nocardioidaceae bacterium]|nr:hypothetical protein [Nocardioidaceae bacterium]
MADRALIRDGLVDALMEKVRNDPYPSIDMLNSLEALLDPLELEEYAEMLLQKVRNDRYPSWNMIYRLHNLAGRQLQAALTLRR